jgi:hypothetical protein
VLQVSVNRRQLLIFTAVIALFVSVAWVSVASRASAASATPVVYVATGENFPDALGAGPAAAIVKGPILLVTLDAIPGETAAELTRLAPDKIIIVGGTAVVSTNVETGLKAYAGKVERIAGANRYDTAAKLSTATYPATIDADTLNGKDSTAFLTKVSYDSNQDGVVDSAEIKIRYNDEAPFTVDMAGLSDTAKVVKCVTAPMTFDGPTTAVASGGLSLQPSSTWLQSIRGYVAYTSNKGSTWTVLNGAGVTAFPYS